MPDFTQLGAPQLQLAPMTPPDVTSVANPYASQYAPPTSLTATPGQATAESLGNLINQQDIEGKRGDVAMQEGQDLADKEDESAKEKIQQSQDHQNFLRQIAEKHEAEHAQTQAAYNDYAAQAGKLGDPTKTFWSDKSVGNKILSGFAAFASGLGASLTGSKGANPYMDYLNKQIENNFEAHKQNIKDLYEKQVQAGRIEDTSQNYNSFMDKAKLTDYELASAHIAPELQAIADKSTGQDKKLLAQKTIGELQQNMTDRKSAYYNYQADLATQAAAQQRAGQKEVRDFYQKALEKYGPEKAMEITTNAFNTSGAPGHQAALGGMVQAVGGVSMVDLQKERQAIIDENVKAFGRQGATKNNAMEMATQIADDEIAKKYPNLTQRGTYALPVHQSSISSGGQAEEDTDPTTGLPYSNADLEKRRALVIRDPFGEGGSDRMATSEADKTYIERAKAANDAVKNYIKVAREIIKNNPSRVFDTTSGEEDAQLAGAAERARAATEALHEEDKSTQSAGRGSAGAIIVNALGDNPFPDKSGFQKLSFNQRGNINGHLIELEKLVNANHQDIESRLRPASKTTPTNSVKPLIGKDTKIPTIKTETPAIVPFRPIAAAKKGK